MLFGTKDARELSQAYLDSLIREHAYYAYKLTLPNSYDREFECLVREQELSLQISKTKKSMEEQNG